MVIESPSGDVASSAVQPPVVHEPVDISPGKNGGVIKLIKQDGRGWENPGTGDTVEVHYTGKLTDGTVFDSSVERGNKFSFTLGKGEVIKGWDIGIASMRRGEICELTIAPEYGYGENGSPPKIPPNATLVFEVELFDWRKEDVTKKKDGGVLKSIKVEGSGYPTPNDGSTVTIHYVLKYQDRVLEEKDLSYIAGEASEVDLIEGIDLAVLKMKKGETSHLQIKRQYAWRELPPRSYNLPEDYETITAEVTLVDFEKRLESWELDDAGRLQSAEYAKNRGTDFFKQSKYSLALRQYKRCIQYIGPIDNANPNEERKNVLLAGYLNLAITCLKLNKPLEAKSNANLALEMDGANIKALFRRGLANQAIKEFESAKQDFEKVLDLDPSNNAARVELANAIKAIKEYRDKEKALYGNMFKVFADRDRERERKLHGDVWKDLSDEQRREFKDAKSPDNNK